MCANQLGALTHNKSKNRCHPTRPRQTHWYRRHTPPPLPFTHPHTRYLDKVIARPADNDISVVIEAQNAVGVFRQRPNALLALDVPNLDQLVVRPAHQVVAREP